MGTLFVFSVEMNSLIFSIHFCTSSHEFWICFHGKIPHYSHKVSVWLSEQLRYWKKFENENVRIIRKFKKKSYVFRKINELISYEKKKRFPDFCVKIFFLQFLDHF